MAVLAPLELAVGNLGSGQGQLRVTGSGGYNAAIEVTENFAAWEEAYVVQFPPLINGNFGQPVTAHGELFFTDPALFLRAIYVRPSP